MMVSRGTFWISKQAKLKPFSNLSLLSQMYWKRTEPFVYSMLRLSLCKLTFKSSRELFVGMPGGN